MVIQVEVDIEYHTLTIYLQTPVLATRTYPPCNPKSGDGAEDA